MCVALCGARSVVGAEVRVGANPVETVEARHPGLASGALTFARLAKLPKGVLLRCGGVEITDAALDETRKATFDLSADELAKNAFFLLEREATPKLLLLLARKATGSDSKKNERDLIDDYLDGVTAKVRVTDEEIARFYKENEQILGGGTLEAMREPIRRHLIGARKEDAVDEHVRTLGRRLKIQVAEAWVDEQALPAGDNPLDKARRSGKPTLALFSDPCG
ncbi:hypothetical protein HQ576_16500 [bacterium]|nr:hypothetical protein [bacterium]